MDYKTFCSCFFFLSVLLNKRPNNNCEGTQEMHIIDGTVGEGAGLKTKGSQSYKHSLKLLGSFN